MTRVLIADDDPDILELLSWHFRDAGVVAFKADSGMRALRDARVHLPDVIILDLLLPDRDGITICSPRPSMRREPRKALFSGAWRLCQEE